MSTPTPQPQQPVEGPPGPGPFDDPSADALDVHDALAADVHDALAADGAPASDELGEQEPEYRPRARPAGRTPLVAWPWWTAFAALFAGFVFAFFGAAIVDIPAAILGVHIVSSENLPPGLELADTAVQDAAFVGAAVLFAHVGVRTVRAWQFGLRAPRVPWLRALLAIPLTYFAFFVFDVIWAAVLNVTEKEKLLETLGANEGTLLLVLSAALTCVMAPICEEFLFRGFFFRALSNLRGPWLAAIVTGLVFGLVHVGSAPAVDLLPLAFLGFALCMLYRATGSLYPCIGVHSLNNCIAFASLEGWSFGQGVLLVAVVMTALVALAFTLRRVGVTSDEQPMVVGDDLASAPRPPPPPVAPAG